MCRPASGRGGLISWAKQVPRFPPCRPWSVEGLALQLDHDGLIGGQQMGILMGRGLRTAVAVGFVCGFGALGLATGPAFADNTIVVNTTQTTYTQGDGLCALGEAVDYANGGSDPDCSTAARSGTTTIQLPAAKIEVPGTLELDLPTNLVGAGATKTDLDGGGIEQVLNVDSTATVTLSNLAITGGMSDPPPACTPVVGTPCDGEDAGNGGGIINLGKLTLNGVTVSGNQTAGGAAGSYKSQPICFNCIVVPGIDGGDGGSGAGIYNGGGTLTVENSTFTGNQTGAGAAGTEGFAGTGTNAGPGVDGGSGGDGGDGAAIFNAQNGTLTITGSTFSDNTTGDAGAGGPGSNAEYNPSIGGSGGGGGNGGEAAGIDNVGALSIFGSTFADNVTGAGGDGSTPGADLGSSGTGGSDQAGEGGTGVALVNAGSAATPIVDSTFSGNVAGPAGTGQSPGSPGDGTISNFDFAGTDLTDVTIADNTSGSDTAINGPGGRPLVETDTIIASNTNTDTAAGPDSCNSDQITDGGRNVAYAAVGCAGVTGDPKLGALANNGGPTKTIALGAGSSAIGLVPVSICTVTTDQRGLHRPAGSACDAGAYEVSPPVLAGVQTADQGPESASISGQVTANLTDTKLTVHYGTTTAYGSTSAATDTGSSSGAKAFSVTLTGLAAATSYHVQVVATNLDGTSSTSDMTVSTPIAATASVTHATVTGSVVLVMLTCTAGGSTCSGALKLSSRVTTKGKKIVAVAATAARARKPKRKTKTRTVGSGRYSIAAGQTKVIKLTLNAYGKRLLKARRRLPTKLTTSGPAHFTKNVTFIYKRSRNKKR
jgi:hypothetical protein